MTGAHLAVTDVVKSYGSGERAVHALRGVSMTAEPGEVVALRGRSGSGKTTLLNILGGLDRPDSGSVHIDAVDVTTMSADDVLALRRTSVAYVFQSFGLVPILTAHENVEIPLRLRGLDPRERQERVDEALDHVGLSAHMKQRPGQLSGGQQQRVALARALAARPALLLADEPTGQLDSETSREIMELIARLAKEASMTTVVTTHDAVLLSLADRVLEISDGALTDISS